MGKGEHMRKRQAWNKTAIGALAAIIAVSATFPAAAQTKPLTKVIFTLDFIPLGRHAPWYAAIAEGFYKEEGLDVSIIPGQGGAESIQAVASGTATLGFMGVPEVALARAGGAKVRLVAVNYQKAPIAVFSLKSGANVDSVKKLQGLTLGSGSGSFTPKILAGFMTQNGLDPKALTVVNIAPPARASALLTKKVPSIEFYVMSKPGLEAGAKGVGESLTTFVPGDRGLELYSNGIGVTDDYLAKNPEVVKAFVRASLKGWKFTLEHPDKAAADEIKFIPSLKSDVVKAEIEIIRNLAVTPDTEKHGLGWFDPAKIKANLDFVTKYIGINGTPPAASDMYATGYLPDPPIKP
jgi:NitT/TauT family transport system substrate-binding protein